MTTPSTLHFQNLGLVDFTPTWDAMKSFTINRQQGEPDQCWFLEHNPVFTLGQAGQEEHILNAHGIPVVKTDRGGQVTYHGPGQLVVYFLLDIRQRKLGVRQLVDIIENSIIQLLADYGIDAATRKGAPGVYVNDDKIAALGLRIKNGCSYHGLSLNVDMNLEPFSWINPCGYPGLGVTQVKDLVGGDHLMPDVQEKMQRVLTSRLL